MKTKGDRAAVYFATLDPESSAQQMAAAAGRLWTAMGAKQIVTKKALVAVKQHFGEEGTANFVPPAVTRAIGECIRVAGGKPFATDSNTLYNGARANAVDHLELARARAGRPGAAGVLAAHASVEGAVYGGERSVMLGGDLVLPGSLARDPRLAYTALGHIHKAQDLNKDSRPPVVYPGSIERFDFGEAADDKYFVIAQIDGETTTVDWRKLAGRRFVDRYVRVSAGETFQAEVLAALPGAEALREALVRLVVEYPRG